MIIDGFNISESGGTSGVSTVSVSASRNQDFVAKTTAIEVDSTVGNIKRVINLTQSAAVGYEYTPVIYIWNDGLSTGEIDLGYVPGDNTVIEMDVEPENSTTQGRKILWFDDFQYYAYNNYQYFANNGSAQTVKTNLNRSVISLSHTIGGWSWAGVTGTIKLFGSDGRAKIYGIKIYEDNVLVRDFVPALDSNGVPCLFDKVGFEYYYFKVNGEISSALTSGGYFVEYLQGNNSDYIDLNYVPKSNTYFEMDIQGIVCAGESNGYGMYWLADDSKCVWRYASAYSIVQFSSLPYEQRYTLKFGKEYYVNGVQQGSKSVGWQTQSLSAYVLAVHDGNNVNGKTTGILYGLKIYEGSTLVRDFVPSIQNNQVGLYDKITGTFRPSSQNTLVSGSVVTEKVIYDESAVTISNSDISTVYVGDTVSLNASTTPTGVTLSYSSSDSGVCTVDSSGVISGVSEGNAVITITSGELRDDENQVHYYPVKKKINIASQINPYAQSSVTISNSDVSILTVGSTSSLNATTDPTGATLTYSSSDQNVATVDVNGVVSGVSTGSTTITITAGDVIDDVNHIYYHGTSKQVNVSCIEVDDSKLLKFTASEAADISASNINDRAIYYKADGDTGFTKMTSSTTISLDSGDSVIFFGENQSIGGKGDRNGVRFSSTGNFSVSGHLTSLLSSDCPSALTSDNEFAFCAIFSGCTKLTSAANLIIPSVLARHSVCCMFQNCVNLTTAPALPATTLAEGCYDYMFEGCTSLTSAPDLPATVLAEECYMFMFRGCTSLTSAPHISATTLATRSCFFMFEGCTSLTTAPTLSATTLAEMCYDGMFKDCTSLAAAPDLPATVLAEECYMFMFRGCSSLTTAPDLSATTLTEGCYMGMFSGSTISAVTVDFTTIPTHYSTHPSLQGWLDNCAQYGVVYAPANREWNKNTGIAYIPSGWTVVDKGTQIDSVTGITISNSEPISAITTGDTFSLNASTTPTGLTLNYSSSDPSIARVSSQGVVSGMSEGNAVITITAPDYFDTTNHIYYVGSSKTVEVEVELPALASWSTDNLQLAFGHDTVNCTSATNQNGININAAYSDWRDLTETPTVQGLKVVVTEQLTTLKLRVGQGVQDNSQYGGTDVDFGAIVDNYALTGSSIVQMTSASTVTDSGVTFTFNNVPAGTYTFSPVLGADNDSHGSITMGEYYGPLNFNCYVDEATPYSITDDVHWVNYSPGMYYATGMTTAPPKTNRICSLEQTIDGGVANLTGTATKASPSSGGYMGIISELPLILDETVSGLTLQIGGLKQDVKGDVYYNHVNPLSLTNVVLKRSGVSYNPTSMTRIGEEEGVTATFNYPVPANRYRLVIGGLGDPQYLEWSNNADDTFDVDITITGGQPVQ